MNDNELEKSFRQLLPSESHLKKSKQEAGKDLDMSSSSFVASAGHDTSMLIQQQLLQSGGGGHNARLSFEDDSFKKFTGEIVKKYMQEEEMRSKHQAHLLKLREKALVEKTDAELAWLAQMKRKAQDKGEDERMPALLSKERGVMQKLREEQESIDKMKEVQKRASENRLRILSQHSEVISWCQSKLKASASVATTTSKGPGEGSGGGGGGGKQTHTASESSFNENEDYSTATTTEEEEAAAANTQILLDDSNANQSLIESRVLKQVKQHLNSEK